LCTSVFRITRNLPIDLKELKLNEIFEINATENQSIEKPKQNENEIENNKITDTESNP
jgi:hypothetical protein